ncbi:MAG TPA: hypothetical protein H9694_00325 [Firmicutes bacterium]|nr:hypothetical protein [Bacillota bacterium]
MKKETLPAFLRNKRNLVIIIVLIFCVIAAGIYAAAACLHSDPKAGTPSAPSETDLAASVTGMHDWVVEEGTEQVDFLDGVTWDDSLVKDVTLDDSGVNLSKIGDYELIYVIHGADDSATYQVSVKVVAKEGAEKTTEGGAEAVTKGTGTNNETEEPLPQDTGNDPAASKAQDTTSPTTAQPSKQEAGGKPSASTKPPAETPAPVETQHVHTWVNVSPENSGHMEYGAECRVHGYSGEEPMFFRTLNDLYLHQVADGCMSNWGTGFKGLAYKYCSGCGEEVITGHVHDFGTIAKEVTFEEVVCECGMVFGGGKDYTALESWSTHVQIYTSHGYPREEHDSYQIVTSSSTRYEATKTCTCGWRPVDDRPVY